MTNDDDMRRVERTDGVLRLPFTTHVFSAACFDTLQCRVEYNGRYDVDQSEPSPPLTDTIRKNLGGTWGGIANFPPPARVVWTASDGTQHEAMVDIGEIFKDQNIRYGPDLQLEDVLLDGDYNGPSIILVVDGRTISVYMKAHISLRRPLIPGNPYSNFRNDLVLAFSQDY